MDAIRILIIICSAKLSDLCPAIYIFQNFIFAFGEIELLWFLKSYILSQRGDFYKKLKS